MTIALTAHEQLVLDFFAGMGPTPANSEAGGCRYLVEDVVRESAGFDHHDCLDDCLAYLESSPEVTRMECCDIDAINIAPAATSC